MTPPSMVDRLLNHTPLKLAVTAGILTTTVGCLLASGEAKAYSCNFGGHLGAPVDCVVDGSWIDSNPMPTDKQIQFVSLPSSGAGDIEWRWIDQAPDGPSYTTDEWHLDVTFDPDLTNATSKLEYIVRIIDSPLYFRDVTLGSLIGPSNASVTKDIYTVVGGAKGTLLGTITNTGTLTLTENYKELFIIDTAATTDSTISAYQNSFRQTPSPLPLLGPGLAAGSLRRLRNLSKILKPA
ncbi:MAG: hypothetical protein VKP70_00420 [Cyanobacteriota bacterium]|nr:hypothetical protein [Cyanobacteriota bacterium]